MSGPAPVCAGWTRRDLIFRRPAGTSRGVMRTRRVWYLFLERDGVTGMGECAPLPGLGLDDISALEPKLEEVCARIGHYLEMTRAGQAGDLAAFPAIRFALEMALRDLENGGRGVWFPAPEPPPRLEINGLVWMGDEDFMRGQIARKLAEGWGCIKIKIGGIDFSRELALLRFIRERKGPDELELRLDANGAFTPEEAPEKLRALAEFAPHSIEQPIAAGQWPQMAELRRVSPVPVALDEELLPLVTAEERAAMLDLVRPHHLVLKPSLLGGFTETERWIGLAESRGIGWWITSALESNAGLAAITQWTQKRAPKGFQGLGTGALFVNNLPASQQVRRGELIREETPAHAGAHRFCAEWLGPAETVELRTSGTTGAPRTIRMPKRAMAASARLTAEALNVGAGARALLCLPVHYVAGKMMIVRALVIGWDLRVVEPCANPLAGMDETFDFAAMTPMQLAAALDAGDLEKVRTLIVGGAPVPPGLAARLRGVRTRVFETWGMTETASHVALRRLGEEEDAPFTALPGVSFSLDGRGCLVVRAAHLGGEPIRTNDLAGLAGPRAFRWLGRADDVINTGGVKVFPAEVERKLAAALGGREFFVAGAPDPKLGERVTLFIEGPPEELPEDLFAPLNRYERPREVRFLPRFRRTASGKVIRRPA